MGSDGMTRPLSVGDLAALELLREDRDQGGDGVTTAQLEKEGLTHFAAGVIRRLRAHRFNIGGTGEDNDPYQLSHDEPASTEAPDDGRADADVPVAVQPSGVSVDTGSLRLFDPPSVEHCRAEAA
jgi:hypothetical protein